MKRPVRAKERTLRALERFSTAMLSALGYLPAAGLVLAAGALLASAGLGTIFPALRWPPLALLGSLAYDGMMAIVQNLSVVFCVGIAAFLARREKHQAAIIALLSYLIFLTAGHTTLEQLGRLAAADPALGLYGTGQAVVLGVQTVDMGVTGGVLLGFLTGWVYNRTSGKKFRPAPLRIYGGVRWTFLCMAGAAAGLGLAACFVWPPVQRAVDGLTGWIAAAGEAGLFLYGFLERFLIPTGLHHLIYIPFQFSSIGGTLTVGDQVYTGAYAVLMAEYSMGLPFSDGIRWMYTGFTKTFGYFGIVAAFIFCARPEKRRRTAAILCPLLLTAALASVTEPLDFLFCFLSPVLWLAHGVIAGTFMVLLGDRLYQRAAVLPGHEPVGRGRADGLPGALPAGGGRDRGLLHGIHLSDPALRPADPRPGGPGHHRDAGRTGGRLPLPGAGRRAGRPGQHRPGGQLPDPPAGLGPGPGAAGRESAALPRAGRPELPRPGGAAGVRL